MADTDIKTIVDRYIKAGWAVIPIHPGKKRPTENDWQKKALKKAYGPDHFGPKDNIGVALGEPSDWRCDVDLDSAEAVAAAGYLLPDTGLIHGRAGKPASHWWYRSEKLAVYLNFKDPVDKQGIVELRAVPSHQTVVPPGVHATGEAIVWERDGEPLDIEPDALKKAVAHVAICALLAKHWPSAAGARHELALVAAGFMAKAMPDDPQGAYRILEAAFRIAGDEDWKDRARAARETIKKASGDADKKITGVPRFVKEFPHGQEIANAILEWLGVKAEGISAGRIEEINERFFKVPYGTDVVVAEPGGAVDGTIQFWSFENFDKLFVHEKVTVGRQTSGMGRYWRESRQSSRFDRFLYAPPGSRRLPLRDGDYNGWRGFTVEAAPGDWSKNKEHVRQIVCGGDEALFEWTMDWMAAMFQRPGEHAFTGLVLMGGQGVGKGHFAEKMLGYCFDRQHYVQVTDRKAIFGDFNDVLSGKVLVLIDEASWGGDKRDAGIIKGLITEDTVNVARKFLPRFVEPSMMHVIIASNEKWPVGLDNDDRRFAVLQVGEAHRNSQAYFEPLLAELANGGRAAMLHELLGREIRSNLKQPPSTAARARLKLESLGDEFKWWFGRLEEGRLLDGDDAWRTSVGTAELHRAFLDDMRARSARQSSLLGRPEFGKLLRRLTAEKAEVVHPRPSRRPTWALPTLEECREVFEAYIQTPIDWPRERVVAPRAPASEPQGPDL